MTPERRLKIKELLHAALALQPETQREFLDANCGQDLELRREVESLLFHHRKAGPFLESEATEKRAHNLLDQEFGPYRIRSLLGAGGMGEVYRAHDTRLGRDVAIKTLPHAFVNDPERLARFRREARTLALLNHPNVAAIYGIEECKGATCLILELVEGDTLRGPLPVAKALEYSKQIAEALEAAHAKGIIHRDLKPPNVKVTPQGRVKVLDFGLAKAVWGAAENQDMSQLPTATGLQYVAGQIVGTPSYMSPEQAAGQDVDKRTDIWAFGCLLYELLTGERAFRGESSAAAILAVMERDPDWKVLPAKTPAKIRGLLRQCLEKDATHRLQDIRTAREVIGKVQRGLSRWQIGVISGAAVAIFAIAGVVYFRAPARPIEPSEWIQLTNFPDSVSQPALSADGRMLTFVRGPDTFITPGQIYVKILPDGEPVQLTHDDSTKADPVFDQDASRIAYTAGPGSLPDTWVVPVLGGQPRRLLDNASGLMWLDKQTLLFSEIKSGTHMGIVTAGENRAGARDVYLPAGTSGMAHRSYPSPDGASILVVEMDRGAWQPCRLVPLDGRSPGRPVGPPDARCTFAAWSRDGKWMYFSSSVGGKFHIWRQRYPDGKPEQITSGLTDEEGIAMSPDSRSFITSVALKQSVVLVRDQNGERQISLEGYSYDPKFTPDGKKLIYRILKGAIPSQPDPSELRVVDLNSGRNERLFPGMLVAGQAGMVYDISSDSQRVVAAVLDRQGKRHLWLAALDRQASPRQIIEIEAYTPSFGKDGEIFLQAWKESIVRSTASMKMELDCEN